MRGSGTIQQRRNESVTLQRGLGNVAESTLPKRSLARMSRLLYVSLLICPLLTIHATPARAQDHNASGGGRTAATVIRGRVTDSAGGVLQGAAVTLAPGGASAVTDIQGVYSIAGLTPGSYTVQVRYVGFGAFTKTVEIAAGAATQVDATLSVAGHSEEILVSSERPRGEAADINRQRTADNIVQVLSSEVITSLPNANIADAVGRLPSVTLERDEGEGKYVQIRGTEPRLSNTTVDGVLLPSPESGVRQIKLDTVASDLVDSVEINKTLQANMDGDGIGGSVNLRTKTAGDRPTVMASAMGGYTPIIGGRGVSQFDGTVGRRFGSDHKLGVLLGGTYDWNGRGINDIEPSPTVSSVSPHYDSMDLRDYMYYRSRWGATGSADYRASNSSLLSVHGLYSHFRNWGQKWVFTLNDGDVPEASLDWRRPETAVANIVADGKHTMGMKWFNWDVATSRAWSVGGSGGAEFTWAGADPNCFYDPNATTNAYVPQFSASCYTPGPTNATDIGNYNLKNWSPPTQGESVQLNFQGSAAFGKMYKAGQQFGTLEFGAKIRNAHKDNQTNSPRYTTVKGVAIPAAQFPDTFTDPAYYDHSYPWPSQVSDFTKIQNYVAANPQQFIFTGGPGPNKNSYDLTERVAAGYVMNTVDLGARMRLVTGVRVEQTHVDTRSFQATTGQVDFKAGGDYTDVLPSAALKIATGENAAIRFVYSRALSRPNPSDITMSVGIPDLTQNPPTVSLGNPDLKAEHANNYDILFEQYFKPLGMVSGGYFYKSLTDPIIATQVRPTSGEFAGFLVSQPGNAGSATLQGFEVAYQQHLTFLPGALAGLGLSANYSYTTSTAHGIPLRTDSPALLRQAPNTWNLSPTYDRGPLSFRLGISYNGANIFAYQYQNLNSDGTPMAPSDLTAGGTAGPGGDNYLYTHLQVDAQASVRVSRDLSAVLSGLNLTNEVFGFYNGSPQYVVQREFYKPTFAIGVRFTPSLR
jgi:TonB-dependent receptor